MQNRKRIIIVGATSGLGRGLAEYYISKGCQVGIVGRRSEILAEMAEGRQNVYKMTADVTDLHTVTECLERLRNEDASLLEEMERQSGNSLSFRSDPALHYEEFYLVDPESGAKIGEHRRQVKKQG